MLCFVFRPALVSVYDNSRRRLESLRRFSSQSVGRGLLGLKTARAGEKRLELVKFYAAGKKLFINMGRVPISRIAHFMKMAQPSKSPQVTHTSKQSGRARAGGRRKRGSEKVFLPVSCSLAVSEPHFQI